MVLGMVYPFLPRYDCCRICSWYVSVGTNTFCGLVTLDLEYMFDQILTSSETAEKINFLSTLYNTE